MTGDVTMKKRSLLWQAISFCMVIFLLCISTVSAETDKADVIIVGAGGAGLAAAVEASEKGASVIVVDLDKKHGGSAAISGGGCFAVGTPLQKKKGFEDSNDQALKDWLLWGKGEADEEWARYYIEHSLHDLYEWLEGMGVVWADVHFAEGNSAPRFHRPNGSGKAVANKIYQTAKKNGVKKWIFNTRIEKIIKEKGRVVGVSGTNTKTGEKVELFGKTVLMATGGFAGSRESVKKFAPWFKQYRFYVCGNKNCTGTGHTMVNEAGGSLTHMENVWAYVYITPNYEDEKDERGLAVRFFPKSNGIWVNAKGKRFHNEDFSGGATGTPAVLSQDPPFAWSVHDLTIEKTMAVMDPSYLKDFSKMNERKLFLLNNSPYIMKADSIGKLASKMKVDPDALKETVERYNTFVETGKDLEQGRNVKVLKKIEKPPFYALQFFPAVRKTLGGVKTDLRCRVLDKNFKPVPGLYAAGELAGMGGGHIQGKASLEGTNLGASIFSGRVAGAWAAQEAGKGKGFE